MGGASPYDGADIPDAAHVEADVSSFPFEAVVARFHRFSEELPSLEGPEDLAAALSRLADDTPIPQQHLEYIVVSSLFTRTFVAVSAFLHSPSGWTTCSCHRVTAEAVMMLLTPDPVAAHAVFEQWRDQFVQAYERNHLASPAAAAAKLIRGSPARAWGVAELARLLGVEPRQLLRQFAREHGISLRDYVHLMRLKRAFPAIVGGTDKIEAIALESGYRSKKDFYRTVWEWLKATPAQLRRLPAAEQGRRGDLLREAYASTLRHRFSGGA